jgi:hypothetical protein
MDNRDSKSSWIREQWRQYEETQTTMAVIFAGIAALFIAGIAAAFLYAKDTTPRMQTASAPAAITVAPAPPIACVPETTGSGGGNQYNPPKQDPRENEQVERPR